MSSCTESTPKAIQLQSPSSLYPATQLPSFSNRNPNNYTNPNTASAILGADTKGLCFLVVSCIDPDGYFTRSGPAGSNERVIAYYEERTNAVMERRRIEHEVEMEIESGGRWAGEAVLETLAGICVDGEGRVREGTSARVRAYVEGRAAREMRAEMEREWAVQEEELERYNRVKGAMDRSRKMRNIGDFYRARKTLEARDEAALQAKRDAHAVVCPQPYALPGRGGQLIGRVGRGPVNQRYVKMVAMDRKTDEDMNDMVGQQALDAPRGMPAIRVGSRFTEMGLEERNNMYRPLQLALPMRPKRLPADGA